MRNPFLLILLCIIISSPVIAQKKAAKNFKIKLDEAVKLAETGDCEGIALAGTLYLSNEEGSYGIRDVNKALEILHKGYDLNCPRATVEYASAFFKDNGINEFDSTINMLARAAAEGYIEADYKMGMLYMYGLGEYYFTSGVSPEWNTKPRYSLALAGQCFKRAADKGHALAAQQLDIVKAVADKPMSRALVAYNSGDYTSALKYFNYAAIDKDSMAMMYLGHMHLYGLGVKADNFDPTQTYYRQAAYNGILSGFFISGQLSERFGTNRKWAIDFYKMGADKGSQECKDAIARLNALTASEYEDWKEKMGYTIKNNAVNLNKNSSEPKRCTMCRGSGRIESPIQHDLYQDKDGKWYTLRGTQYETCWACKGAGVL